jgi:7-cyano-7-deazaguanine synthase
MDSVTLAHHLAREGFALDLLSFDYGQRHRRELAYAEATAKRVGASWHLIDLAAAGIQALLAGSALTDPTVEVPDGHYAAPSMAITVVPNRNAVMLAVAYAAADSWGADAVALAVHGGDHFIYPDCRPEFVAAFQEMERLAIGKEPTIELLAPFSTKTKADLVTIGTQLGVPFGETWSCYKGGELHCGLCGTCFERREAFDLAGVPDPTTYEAA